MKAGIKPAAMLAALAALCPGARGGERAGVPTYYVRGGRGRISYSVQDKGTGVAAVEVYVSSDGRKSWKKHFVDEKLVGKTTCDFEKEGIFEFATVAVDKIGNCEKELTQHTLPGFRVIVDRSAPRVTAQGPKGPPEGVLAPAGAKFRYSWTAEDRYLQPDSVELQIRFKGNPDWRAVAKGLPAKGTKTFRLPEVKDGLAEVRFVARDRAGNQGHAGAGSIRFDRLAPEGRITGPQTATSLQTEVGYEVSDRGVAGLAAVTLWITANGGRTWRKLASAPPQGKSIKIRLPRSGVYGLALSARDAVGNLLAPPSRRTKPPFTLRTDTGTPRLELVSKLEGQALSTRDTMTIKWKATDQNLGVRPVTVEFSPNGGRTWTVVAKELRNTGSFAWKPPNVDSARCLLRVTVRDVLGNKSQVTSHPFTMDNQPPESKVKFEPLDQPKGKKGSRAKRGGKAR